MVAYSQWIILGDESGTAGLPGSCVAFVAIPSGMNLEPIDSRAVSVTDKGARHVMDSLHDRDGEDVLVLVMQHEGLLRGSADGPTFLKAFSSTLTAADVHDYGAFLGPAVAAALAALDAEGWEAFTSEAQRILKDCPAS
jgi:hypothetical protein